MHYLLIFQVLDEQLKKNPKLNSYISATRKKCRDIFDFLTYKEAKSTDVQNTIDIILIEMSAA